MRRTAEEVRYDILGLGIISAHAENSRRDPDRFARSSDHLRACGEQVVGTEGCEADRGSSPRMRRTVVLAPVILIHPRIISAHAENRSVGGRSSPGAGDHLRACGEQSRIHAMTMRLAGSSPRMRRTGSRPTGSSCRGRIISAHAENSGSSIPARRASRDHLRACGEQCALRVTSLMLLGSSPRMRRTGRRDISGNRPPRIISAHAENSDPHAERPEPGRDHLRACGEQMIRKGKGVRKEGSSPRMRRTAPASRTHSIRCRIISAHAENSASADATFT